MVSYLDSPVLIRSYRTRKRGTVGVMATEGMDGVFFRILSPDDIDLAERELDFGCVRGTVDIVDCFPPASGGSVPAPEGHCPSGSL